MTSSAAGRRAWLRGHELLGPALVLLASTGCGKENKAPPPVASNAGLTVPEPSKAPPPSTASLSAPSASSAGPVVDLVVGTGKEAVAGSRVKVHYVGTLTSGKQFDSSYDKKRPYTFTIGAGGVIKGWDAGVPGMRVGGKRKLTIPPALGYGVRGRPPVIPSNATLIFEIELLDVQ